MANITNVKKRARSKIGVSLDLAKRRQGVTQREATSAGGGSRLAPQIFLMKRQGHLFHDAWEKAADGTRYKRYWWLGFESSAGAGNG